MECAQIILPCPFCGSSKIGAKKAEDDCYVVACDLCGGVGPGDTVEDHAVQRWNSRSVLAASFRAGPTKDETRPILGSGTT